MLSSLSRFIVPGPFVSRPSVYDVPSDMSAIPVGWYEQSRHTVRPCHCAQHFPFLLISILWEEAMLDLESSPFFAAIHGFPIPPRHLPAEAGENAAPTASRPAQTTSRHRLNCNSYTATGTFQRHSTIPASYSTTTTSTAQTAPTNPQTATPRRQTLLRLPD